MGKVHYEVKVSFLNFAKNMKGNIQMNSSTTRNTASLHVVLAALYKLFVK